MSKYILYVGTYTIRDSRGVYAYRFDTVLGRLSSLGLVSEADNPSFLAIDEKRSCVYAVSEVSTYKGQRSGALRAYKTDPRTGALTLLNEVGSLGAGPCYVSLDKTGNYALTANYHSGSIAVFPVLEDGRLGQASAFVQHHSGSSVNPVPQREPHAHAVQTSPDNRFVLAADLGLDRLLVYLFDPTKGSIAISEPPFAKVQEGAGPRHFAFHPNGRFVYLVNELASKVTVFAYDLATASLHEAQSISSLPDGFSGNSDAAELRVDKAGRFLYVSNRGHDSIAVFAINGDQGTLSIVEHVGSGGKTPRNFATDPTGKYLLVANENSDNIVIFRIDSQSGKLAATGQVYKISSPVFLAFLSSE